MTAVHCPQPQPHHHHPLTKAERDHLGGWTGLLWMDYLNADSGAALQIIEAEKEEIAEYEAKHEEEEQQELQKQSNEVKPSPPKIEVQEAPPIKKEVSRLARVKAEEDEHPEWEMDSCEIGGFEDGIDDIEGPIWDDPLDKKAVERQMNGGVSLKKDDPAPKIKEEERETPERTPRSDSEDDKQQDNNALHRCSVDTLDMVSTEDLVAAAEALQISERNHKPRPQCSHCGGSRLRKITTAEKARALVELLEIEDAKAFFEEIGLQY